MGFGGCFASAQAGSGGRTGVEMPLLTSELPYAPLKFGVVRMWFAGCPPQTDMEPEN